MLYDCFCFSSFFETWCYDFDFFVCFTIDTFLDSHNEIHKSADVEQHQLQNQQSQSHGQHNTNSNANGSSVGVVGSEHHASIYPRADENHGGQNVRIDEMDMSNSHLKTTALNVLQHNSNINNETNNPNSNLDDTNIHDDAINNGIMPDTPQLGYFGEVECCVDAKKDICH